MAIYDVVDVVDVRVEVVDVVEVRVEVVAVLLLLF